MELMETGNILKIEKQIVSSWLRDNGYNKVRYIEGMDGVEIEADSVRRHICVHIKIEDKSIKHIMAHRTSVEKEARRIKAYANSNYREPWVAILHTNSKGKIDDDIIWIDLSR